jgi:hypothetical protein
MFKTIATAGDQFLQRLNWFDCTLLNYGTNFLRLACRRVGQRRRTKAMGFYVF